jgi:hypothetical protein
LQLPGHILELESSIVADGILDKGRKKGDQDKSYQHYIERLKIEHGQV